jgi:NADH dehydrogenase FAD-containing subunit
MQERLFGLQGTWNSIMEQAGIQVTEGRVKVNPDLRAPEFENLFIIGDCSIFVDEKQVNLIHQRHKLPCNKG